MPIHSVISSGRIPIKVWAREVEEGALEQAERAANLPFSFGHIALMPDVHQGYGVPIGCVLCTRGVIIPNAVGVDIGCGMLAVKTNITEIDKDQLRTVRQLIIRMVPTGFSWRTVQVPEASMPHLDSDLPIVASCLPNARYQMGTLGGGNHFIEIQRGDDGHVWAMIHSGSRNVGKQVADHYHRAAKTLNSRWFSSVPPEWNLAFLPEDDDLADKYTREMHYCVQFALQNRQMMMQNVLTALASVRKDVESLETINIAHNYAEKEHHFGTNVIVHRKGATSAASEQVGIIPGSQGSNSYVVLGKGVSDSFKSCSHGAGRKLSRKKARETLDFHNEVAQMEQLGVVHNIHKIRHLDEAPGAYKDINDVMADQEDLVSIRTTLTPLASVKDLK